MDLPELAFDPDDLDSLKKKLTYDPPIGSVSALLQKLCNSCGKKCRHKCERCQLTFYCSAACQEADWPEHAEVCESLTPEAKQEIREALKTIKESIQIMQDLVDSAEQYDSTIADATANSSQSQID